MHSAHTPDGGPVYTETQWDLWIKEPFNATSALLFAVMAVYWLYRLRGEWKQRRFLVGCLVVLTIGGVGGALFHGLRTSRVFLLMDILPILLIAVSLSVWLWRRVLPSPWAPFFVVAGFAGLQSTLRSLVPRSAAINLGYALTAVMIVLPLVLVLRANRWVGARSVAAAVALFSLALVCRSLDPFSGAWLAVGTHWLWHVFSAVSVWLLIAFLSRLKP